MAESEHGIGTDSHGLKKALLAFIVYLKENGTPTRLEVSFFYCLMKLTPLFV